MPLHFLDVSELSSVETLLRRANDKYRDRQVRVKLEAYGLFKPSALQENKRRLSEIAAKTRKKLKTETLKGFLLTSLPPTANTSRDSPQPSLQKALVSALNLAFTDYDFSSVKAEQFVKVEFQKAFEQVVQHFSELSSKTCKAFTVDLWRELETVIGNEIYDPELKAVVARTMEGTQVYQYVANDESEIDADPLAPLGNLWAFNFLFCNAKTGKVVLLAASCRARKFSQEGARLPELGSYNSFLDVWVESDFEDECFPSEDEEELSDTTMVNPEQMANTAPAIAF